MLRTFDVKRGHALIVRFNEDEQVRVEYGRKVRDGQSARLVFRGPSTVRIWRTEKAPLLRRPPLVRGGQETVLMLKRRLFESLTLRADDGAELELTVLELGSHQIRIGVHSLEAIGVVPEEFATAARAAAAVAVA